MFRDRREEYDRRNEEGNREYGRIFQKGSFVCKGVPCSYNVKSINGSRVNVDFEIFYNKKYVSWLDSDSFERAAESYVYWHFPQFITNSVRVFRMDN